MTAHELARILLAGRDAVVILNRGYNELANGCELTKVTVERCAVPVQQAGYDAGREWLPAEWVPHQEPGLYGPVRDVVNLTSGKG